MAPRAADSIRRSGNGNEHAFAAENVIITAPDQDDGKDVRVQKDDIETEPGMYTQADFYPRRLVMNLLLDKDRTGADQGVIKPAVTIRIKVTDEDERNAGSRDKVKAAYWYQGKWIIFGKKHGFQIDSNGYAVATLAVWGDPPIGMGP